jgi:hypothetical protein
MISQSSCRRCRSWEPLWGNRDAQVGLCRRFSFPPAFDAWPMMEVGDSCAEWKAAAE